jgi:hypothetical protein
LFKNSDFQILKNSTVKIRQKTLKYNRSYVKGTGINANHSLEHK